MESFWLFALIAGGAFIVIVPFALLIVTIVFVVVAVRSSGPTVVNVTLWVARACVVFAALGLLGSILGGFLNSGMHVALPIDSYTPKLPADVKVSNVDSISATIGGVSVGTRMCWVVGQALYSLVFGTVAVLVALTCKKMRAGQAFAPVVSQLAMIAALVVMIGGMAAAILTDQAGSMAAAQIGQEIHQHAGFDSWPQAGSSDIPIWPIGAGLGLGVLSALLRHGSQLQRDTEGLV